MRVMLTAGFDRSAATVALGELLRRDGHTVTGAIVVSPFRLARLRSEVRRRGVGFVGTAARRLLGRRAAGPGGPLERFLADAGVRHRSLRLWCREHGIACTRVGGLNDETTVEQVRTAAPDLVLYGGGGIVRRSFLEASRRRVLNAHSGPLPEIRGMNACEWSLLLGLPCAVTVHFIDERIDTGPIVERIPVPVERGDTIDTLRERCVVAGLDGLRRAVQLGILSAPARPGAERHRQCYLLAPALLELAELALIRRVASAGRK